jgi:general secretion pathway protein G
VTGTKGIRTCGYTLIDMMIVVVILAILAAIAIPQFTEASDQARAATLLENLRALRSQINLYRLQHNDTWPTNQLVNQITRYSNVSGGTRAKPSASFPLGPYVVSFPENPISGISTVRFVTKANQVFKAKKTDQGWWYNTATGTLRADLTDVWVDKDGTPLNQK